MSRFLKTPKRAAHGWGRAVAECGCNGPDSDDGLGGAQGARSSQSAPTELSGRIAALEEAQLQPQALVARPTRPGVAVAADGDGA